jgi:hypothetical protein
MQLGTVKCAIESEEIYHFYSIKYSITSLLYTPDTPYTSLMTKGGELGYRAASRWRSLARSRDSTKFDGPKLSVQFLFPTPLLSASILILHPPHPFFLPLILCD